MTKNPLTNAFLAALYVAVVGSIPTIAGHIAEPKNSIFGPIAFLSVFTLSAAVMAFLFFYQPVSLLIDNQKPAAFKLLSQTIAAFAGITIIILLAVLATQFL